MSLSIEDALSSRAARFENFVTAKVEKLLAIQAREAAELASRPVDRHYDSVGEGLAAMDLPKTDIIELQNRLNTLGGGEELPITGIMDAPTVARLESYAHTASNTDGVDYAASLRTQSTQSSALMNLSVRMDNDIVQMQEARNQNLFVVDTPEPAVAEPASEPEVAATETEVVPAPPPVTAAPEPEPMAPTLAQATPPAPPAPAEPAPPAPPTAADFGVAENAYAVAQQGHAALSDDEKRQLQANADKLNAPPGMESVFALLAMVIGREDLLKNSGNDLWSGEQPKQPVDIVRQASGQIDEMANGPKQQQAQGAAVATPTQPEIKVTELPPPTPQELQAAQAAPPPPPASTQPAPATDGPPSYSFAQVKEGVSTAATATKDFVVDTYNSARGKLASMLGISEPAAKEADEHMASCTWQKEGCLKGASQGMQYETVALGGLSAPQMGGGAAIGGKAV